MPAAALGLALGAAVLHAIWNLMIAASEDVHAATGLALVAGCVALTPVAVLTWRADADVAPFAVASSGCELAYFALLAHGYQRHDMSGIYPVARGSAPVLVLAWSAVAGHVPSAAQVGGVLAIGAGVVAVRGGRWRGAGAGLVVGVFIAAYTVIDSHGVGHASPFAYLELTLAGPAMLYAVAVRSRLRAAIGVRAALAGIFSVGAYGLVLAALQRAPAAAVAAVRESSVVIGVALAALVLRERVSRARAIGAVAVVVGIAIVALA